MTKHEIIKANYGKAMNKMRQKIRFLVRDLGWLHTDSRGPLSPTEWTRAGTVANQWFMENSHSPVRKPVENMTHKELRTACTVLERLKLNYYKQVSKPQ
jgi:hypothetical protein